MTWRPATLADATDIESVTFSSFSGTSGVQMVTSSTNASHKQVYVAGGGAANIVSSGTQLSISLYDTGGVGAVGPDGLYAVSGTPKKEVRITGTSGPVAYEVYHDGLLISDFTLEQPTADSISRTNSSSGRKDVITTDNDGDEHTVTEEIWDVNPTPDKLLKKTTTITLPSSGPGEITVEDPDGEARTTTTYRYPDDGEEGWATGEIAASIYPDGSWVKYDYDSQHRVIMVSRPWKDLPADPFAAVGSNSQRTTTTYDSTTGKIESEVATILGVETNRETYLYTTGTASGTGATLNIETQTSTPAGGPETVRVTRTFEGDNKLHSVDHEDGRRDTYAYESGLYVSGTFTPDAEGEYERTIVTHGTVEHPEGIAHKTTREITIENADGRTLSEEIEVFTDDEETPYERIALTLHTYDEDGNREQTTKNGRITYSATYYSGGKVDTETDEQGIETAYTYQGDNLLTVTKKGVAAATISDVPYAAQPDIVTTYDYDLLGRQVSEVVTSGTATLPARTTTYTVAGDIASQTEAGLTTTFIYENGGRKTTTTQPTGATEIVENYLDGQTKSITGTGVLHQFFDYGVHPSEEEETDGYPEGSLWTESRLADDESPRWEKTTTDGSRAHVLTIEKPTFDGTGTNTTAFTYNTKGQLTKEDRTGFADTLYEYDELGRQFRSGLDMDASGTLGLSSTDRIRETEENYDGGPTFYRNQREWGYYHDASSQRTYTSLPRWQLTGLATGVSAYFENQDVWGEGGNEWESLTIVTTETNRAEKLVTTITDTHNSSINPETIVRNGLLQSQNTPDVGKPVKFTYDAFGRETGRTNPRTDVVTTTAYSATTGQIASVSTGTAATLSTAYEYYPTGSGANTGRLKKVTENGRATYYSWTLRGELHRQWGAAYPAEFTYNTYGQLETMAAYRGGSGWQSATWPGAPGAADTTTWLYHEPTGLLSGKRDNEDEGADYTWNDATQLATHTQARGPVTTHAYNLAGELAGKTYSDATPPVAITYNRRGLPATITDGSGVRTRTYTLDGQLDEETYVSGVFPAGWVLSRDYIDDTTVGKLTGVSLLAPTPVYSGTFGYGDNGLLSVAQGSLAPLAPSLHFGRFTHSTLLASMEIIPAGDELFEPEFSYDVLDRLSGFLCDSFSTGNGVDGAIYEFNSNSQYSQMTLSSDESYWTYTYNDRGELHEATRYYDSSLFSPYDLYAWLYDNQGNREQFSTGMLDWMDYTPNTLNQYTQIETPAATETLQHDADGNRTQDARWDYTWDAENRLVSVQTSALAISGGATPTKLVFGYDSQHRRVSKTVLTLSGTAYTTVASHKVFAYDGWRPIAEITFSGTTPNVAKTYYWGLDVAGWRDGQSTEAAGGIGGLWMIQSGTSAYFPMYDAMGNVLALAEAGTNAKAATYCYDPWGNLLTATGTAAEVNPFRFSTKYQDEETGLIHFPGESGGRYYDPRTGRWLSRDPIGENGGIGLYGYCGNDPANRIDPFGEKSSVTMAMTPQGAGKMTKITLFIDVSLYWECSPKKNGKPILSLEQQRRLTSNSEKRWNFTSRRKAGASQMLEYEVVTTVTARYTDAGEKKENPFSENIVNIEQGNGTSLVTTWGASGKGRTRMKFYSSDDQLVFDHESGHVIGHRDMYWDNGLSGFLRRTTPINGWRGNLMSDRSPVLNWKNAEEIMWVHDLNPPGIDNQPQPPFDRLKPPSGIFP